MVKTTTTNITATADRPKAGTLLPFFDSIWKNRRLGLAIAAAAALLLGLLMGLTMPRTPATAPQALIAIFAGLAVGLIAGMAMKSRWAMLLAPLANVIAFEIARWGVPGAVMGPIRLDNVYGILGFVLGRGLYALLVLLPMVLGASLGCWLSRKMSGEVPQESSVKKLARWTPTIAVALILALLAVGIAMPASIKPVAGADGKLLAGSIAELTTVKLGGHDQYISIRGQNASNPVLLYLSGGPGQSDMAWPRALFGELEKNFTIVCYDQRGTGNSYSQIDPASTMTFDQAVSDTAELSEYLCERFHQDKIYLMGESYGTILGVKTAQARPDLFYGYIGSGQMVCPRETDLLIYKGLMNYSEKNGDTGLAANLKSFGEPPYKDVYAYSYIMGYYEVLYGPYTPPAEYERLGAAAGNGPFGIFAPEYSLIDKANVLRGLLDTFSILYPQLQGIDFRKDATKLDVPVYLLDGDYELAARSDLANEWYGLLDAPKKHIYTIENSGHATAFEGVEEFTRIMNEVVLPETYPGHA